MLKNSFALSSAPGSGAENAVIVVFWPCFRALLDRRPGRQRLFQHAETIIELLEITVDEERAMRTIISDDERRRRDREEKKEQRREAGAMSREDYEGQAAHRRVEAPKLRSEGLTVREIAVVLGISERRVKQLLKESQR